MKNTGCFSRGRTPSNPRYTAQGLQRPVRGAGQFRHSRDHGLGISLRATDKLTLALDWQETLYSEVPAVGNSSTLLFAGVPLGADNGPGFCWQDINVYRLGVQYRIDPTWAVRAGYNRSDTPITSRDVTFNILAPGVVQDHVTLGFTYTINPTSEISMAYGHAFENEVTGPSLVFGGRERIWMSQDFLGIGWNMKF